MEVDDTSKLLASKGPCQRVYVKRGTCWPWPGSIIYVMYVYIYIYILFGESVRVHFYKRLSSSLSLGA